MPQPKKQSRPRLDAIKRHILAGSYDDELWEIKAAIDERNRRRQEVVEKLVKDVYGEGFTVRPEKDEKKNPFVERQAAREAGEVLPGESPHVQDPASQPGLPDDDELAGDDDYESRSPIIGSVE